MCLPLSHPGMSGCDCVGPVTIEEVIKVKLSYWDWRESTAGKAFALHAITGFQSLEPYINTHICIHAYMCIMHICIYILLCMPGVNS